MTEPQDGWAAGATYEQFMGRWSRRLATGFVAWLDVPPGAHWLDVGCGTGALSEAICAGAAPASVTGCDPSGSFIGFAREKARDPRISFVVAGTGALPPRDGGYGGIASLLALNFFPDPVAAVLEMKTLAAPGGAVGACVWDYAGEMQFLRRFWDAVTAQDSAAAHLDEGRRFPLCDPEALTRTFLAASLAEVRCAPLEITTEFADFEDYWRPCLGGTGPAPSYVASLDPAARERLAQRVEETLPRGANGTISLVARAWAVRGTVA